MCRDILLTSELTLIECHIHKPFLSSYFIDVYDNIIFGDNLSGRYTSILSPAVIHRCTT